MQNIVSRLSSALVCSMVLSISPTVATLGAVEQTTHDSIALLKAQGNAFSSVAAKVMPAVVYIAVEKKIVQSEHQFKGGHPFEHFFRQGPPHQQRKQPHTQGGQGSGFIVTENGYILTNNHVVEGADLITVTLDDDREYEAEIIGTDPNSDIALIKIDGEGLPIVPMGSSDDTSIGSWVLAVGNPFGLDQTITAGIISAKGRTTVGILGREGYENFIQTDAAINPGNSGGPLVDLDGEAVGINTAIFSRSGGSMGIGFAIPMDMVKPIYEQLREHGSVIRGFLGVMLQPLTPDLAKGFDIEINGGALISEVMDDTPAAQAGLQQGDIILGVEEKKIDNLHTLRNHIAFILPDTTVTMHVLRNGEHIDIDVTIGSRASTQSIQLGLHGGDGYTGLRVETLSEKIKENLGIDNGVLISQVEEDSPAAQANLQPGQIIVGVNQHRISSPQELKAAVQQANEQKSNLLLLIRDGERARYVVLKIQ